MVVHRRRSQPVHHLAGGANEHLRSAHHHVEHIRPAPNDEQHLCPADDELDLCGAHDKRDADADYDYKQFVPGAA